MTIDVGYAHLALDDGTELDFVDVPGHDKLVGNMLVGAGEIDAALLVVAADDGPRAQTLEHLALLDALGIRDGDRGRHQDRRRRGRSASATVVEDVRATARRDVARRRRRSSPRLGADRDGIDALRLALVGAPRPRSWPDVGRSTPRPPEARDRPGLLGQGPRDRGDRHASRRPAGARHVAAAPSRAIEPSRVRELQVHGAAVDGSRSRPDGAEPRRHRRGDAPSRDGADRRTRTSSRPTGSSSASAAPVAGPDAGARPPRARRRSTPPSGAAGATPSTCPTGGRRDPAAGRADRGRAGRSVRPAPAVGRPDQIVGGTVLDVDAAARRSRAADRRSGSGRWPRRSQPATPRPARPRRGSTSTGRLVGRWRVALAADVPRPPRPRRSRPSRMRRDRRRRWRPCRTAAARPSAARPPRSRQDARRRCRGAVSMTWSATVGSSATATALRSQARRPPRPIRRCWRRWTGSSAHSRSPRRRRSPRRPARPAARRPGSARSSARPDRRPRAGPRLRGRRPTGRSTAQALALAGAAPLTPARSATRPARAAST